MYLARYRLSDIASHQMGRKVSSRNNREIGISLLTRPRNSRVRLGKNAQHLGYIDNVKLNLLVEIKRCVATRLASISIQMVELRLTAILRHGTCDNIWTILNVTGRSVLLILERCGKLLKFFGEFRVSL